MTKKNELLTAYHEAGHVVVALAMHEAVDYVRIYDKPVNKAWGEYRLSRESCWQFPILTAGCIAERMFCPTIRDPGTWEIFDFMNQCSSNGIPFKEVGRILKEADRDARKLLIANWSKVELLAQALISRKYLTGDEVAQLLNE